MKITLNLCSRQKIKTAFGIFIFSVALTTQVGAQTDSLVRLADLQFSNTQEKNTFSTLKDKPTMEEALFFLLTFSQTSTAPSTAAIQENIQKFMASESKSLEGKPKDKMAKEWYKAVHRNYLKKYKLSIDFHAIFETGTYNCLTATALYALVFQRAGIPYHIKEKPSHVYLVAYPDREKILLESTDPQNGFFAFNETFQKQYLQSMVASKMLSEEEFKNGVISDLFNKYYFSDQNIGLKELIGLHYYNHAIQQLLDKDPEAALANLKKAYYLYPSTRNYVLVKNTLQHLLATTHFKKEEELNNALVLARILNAEKSKEERQQAVEIFKSITQDQLIGSGDVELYTKTYQRWIPVITDSTLASEIKFIYNYEMAYVGLMKGNTNGAEQFLKAAYSIHPHNVFVQNAVLEYFAMRMNNISDPKKCLDLLLQMTAIFDFMNVSPKAQTIKSHCYLALADREYQQNQVLKGDDYLNSFLQIKESIKDFELNENYIEKAFISAGSAYFRKGNKVKAREKFKDGLKLIPQSFELKERLKQLESL